jgi:ribosome biogenesis GTPase A
VLLLNKIDCANVGLSERLGERVREREGWDHVVIGSAKGGGGWGLDELGRVIGRERERQRESGSEGKGGEGGLRILVVGLPNVGKSSTINRLRRTMGTGAGGRGGRRKGGAGERERERESAPVSRRSARSRPPPRPLTVEARAGTTLRTHETSARGGDTVLIDTPGILLPASGLTARQAAVLGIIGAVPTRLLDPRPLAATLLATANATGQLGYVPALGLAEPSDDISAVLEAVAVSHGIVRRTERETTTQAAQVLLRLFSQGKLGTMTLDDPEDEAALDRLVAWRST